MKEDRYTKRIKENPPNPSYHLKATFLWLLDAVKCLTLIKIVL